MTNTTIIMMITVINTVFIMMITMMVSMMVIMSVYSQNSTHYSTISMYVIDEKYLQISAQDVRTHVDCGM